MGKVWGFQQLQKSRDRDFAKEVQRLREIAEERISVVEAISSYSGEIQAQGAGIDNC